MDGFDAQFFNISPREATMMDPQQRLLLEVVWEALENAGIPASRLHGSQTGVFIGIVGSDYERIQDLTRTNEYFATGVMTNIAAGRVAQFLGVHGPALAVDTACSSSLVAVHLACENLHAGRCDVALAGGVNLMLSPDIFSALCHLKALSPDGRSKAFEADADGYGRGEGCGVIVLKRLSDAVRDDDRILAVIRGSAVNHDGPSTGLTAPNPQAQQKLIRAALADAGLSPADVGYVEAHGTGTALGDPIEVEALQAVYAEDRTTLLRLGSIKANIGHLEAAAGVAGLMKLVLAVGEGVIPPHVPVRQVNPRIDLAQIPAEIPDGARPWSAGGSGRLGAISSFGFSGTNAHLIVGEAPVRHAVVAPGPAREQVLTLSAKSLPALLELATRYRDDLVAAHASFSDFCFTANACRTHFAHRIVMVAPDAASAVAQLDDFRQSAERSPLYAKARSHASEAVRSTSLHELVSQYRAGADIDWDFVYRGRGVRRVQIPTYAFQRKRFWNAPRLENSSEECAVTSLEPEQIESPDGRTQFIFRWSAATLPGVRDTHGLIHIGYYQEMLARAMRKMKAPAGLSLRSVRFLEPLLLPDEDAAAIHLILDAQDDGYAFRVFSRQSAADEWRLHIDGRISREPYELDACDLGRIRQACVHEHDGASFYENMQRRGVDLGPGVRWIEHIYVGDGEALARFRPGNRTDPIEAAAQPYPPGVLDACAQLAHAVTATPDPLLFMVAEWGEAHFAGTRVAHPMWCRVTIETQSSRTLMMNATLFDADGVPAAEIRACRMVAVSGHRPKLVPVDDDPPPATDAPSVLQNLCHTLASWLEMAPEEVDPDEPLRSYGLDSLVSMQLRAWVEERWRVRIGIPELLRGPSLRELTALILRQRPAPVPPESQPPWISCRKQVAAAQMRLFCFPYGGGGASLFRRWQAGLPDGIEVCPIQLPGREERLQETALRRLEPLVTALTGNLDPFFDRPFAFYGHSMGALLAYAVADRLRSNGSPQPDHIFAAAFTAPQLVNTWLRRCLEALYQLGYSAVPEPTEKALRDVRDIFVGSEEAVQLTRENQELMNVVLPTLMADLAVVDSFRYRERPPLACSITALHGVSDTRVSREEMAAWRDLTTGSFCLHEFPGDHFFLHPEQSGERVLELIRSNLYVSP